MAAQPRGNGGNFPQLSVGGKNYWSWQNIIYSFKNIVFWFLQYLGLGDAFFFVLGAPKYENFSTRSLDDLTFSETKFFLTLLSYFSEILVTSMHYEKKPWELDSSMSRFGGQLFVPRKRFYWGHKGTYIETIDFVRHFNVNLVRCFCN